MNKDLEKEYKQLMTENVPDLWGRIEAGLEPKKSTERVKFCRKYRAWGMAAAACLCLAVAAPMIYNGVFDNSSGGSKSGGAANDASFMDNMSGGNMYEDGEGENYSPQMDYGADGEDVNLAAEAQMGEYDSEICTIIAEVTEVLDEEGKNVYLVQVVETDWVHWSEGDIIRLYELDRLDEELTVGETYLFDIMIQETDDSAEEYFIYDCWSEK